MVTVAIAAAPSAATPNRVEQPTELRYRTDPDWSPDGKQIVFADHSGAGDLFVINADGSGLRQITHSEPYPAANYGARQPSWSPDGRTIAFGYGSTGISLIDVDGTNLRRLVQGVSFAPAWSPRGRRIAYAAGGELNGLSIYVVAPDGSQRELVARRPCCEDSYNGPTWSPDGERMAFTVGPAPDTGSRDTYLGVVDHFRGAVLRVALGRYPIDPDWSPDERRIVFADFSDWGRRRVPRIVVLTVQTGALRSLGTGSHPRWSADGRRIAFSRGGRIWIMRANGSGAHALTPTG